MGRFARLALLSAAALIPVAAQAEPVPPPVEAMIRAASDSGDATALKTTADLAKKTNPRSVAEVDALVAELQKAAADKHQAELASQGFLEGWKGQGEAGFSNSTGNTKSTGIAVGLTLAKESLHWRHGLVASVDYLRNSGETQKERYFVGYQGNYKINGRLYVLALGSWERDRFSGFSRRFSEAVGVGYSVIRTPGMTLNLEAGPALRQTRYITGLSDNNVAGRAALDYQWQIAPTIALTEKASFYGQSDDSTLTSETGLSFKLIGALSARASFLYQYETDPPPLLDKTNTTTRFTLVYSF